MSRPRNLVIAVLVFGLVLHLYAIGNYGWFRDELYYVACGRRLAMGYVDHPPVVAWLARLVEALGGSLIALRLIAVVSGLVVMAQVAWLASRMGGGAVSQALAAFAIFCSPTYAFMFHYFSMNCLEMVFGTSIVCVITLLLDKESLGQWALLGILVGVGCLTKYGIAFYTGALVLAVLASPHRRALRSVGCWGAVFVAVLVVLPHVIWQHRHGFPTAEFMHNARTLKNTHFSLAGYLGAQLASVGPANALMWIPGMIALLARRVERSSIMGTFAVAYVLLGVFYASTGGKPYYLMVAYPPLFAAGAVFIEAWLRRAKRVYAFGALGAYGTLSLAIVPMGLPILPTAALVPYARWLSGATPKQERGRIAALPQHYADMFGWREQVAALQTAVAQLPANERSATVVLASNYGQAAACDVLGVEPEIPVMCPHNSYFDWGPQAGSPVLAVGFEREQLLRYYAEVTRVGVKRCSLCMPAEDDVAIYACRLPRRDVNEAWTQFKLYR